MGKGRRVVVEDVSLVSLPLFAERMKWWHVLVEPLSPTEFCHALRSSEVHVSRRVARLISHLCGVNVQPSDAKPRISVDDELILVQALETPERRVPLAELAEMIKEGKVRFYRVTFSEYFY